MRAVERAAILVEGVSDRIAVETLAGRRGRDLAAEGVSVVPIGGAQAVGRFLDELGPRGRNLALAGLCDAGEERDFRRGLERAGLGSDLDPRRDGAPRFLRLRRRPRGRADPRPRRRHRRAGRRGSGRAAVVPHDAEAARLARPSRRGAAAPLHGQRRQPQDPLRAAARRGARPRSRCRGRSRASSPTSEFERVEGGIGSPQPEAETLPSDRLRSQLLPIGAPASACPRRHLLTGWPWRLVEASCTLGPALCTSPCSVTSSTHPSAGQS